MGICTNPRIEFTMSFENYNQVKNKIENEGLGYFLQRYCSSDYMPDEEGKSLFEKAEDALNEFEAYVEMKAEKELEDPDFDPYE